MKAAKRDKSLTAAISAETFRARESPSVSSIQQGRARVGREEAQARSRLGQFDELSHEQRDSGTTKNKTHEQSSERQLK